MIDDDVTVKNNRARQIKSEMDRIVQKNDIERERKRKDGIDYYNDRVVNIN